MSHWQKLQSLGPNALKDVIQFYASQRIPIEVRDFFAVWIEGSLKRSSPEKFCTGLRKQLQDKITSLRENATVPFYVTGKLLEFETGLNTCNAAIFQDVYSRFETCLEFERKLLDKTNTPASTSPSSFHTTHFNYGQGGGSVTHPSNNSISSVSGSPLNGSLPPTPHDAMDQSETFSPVSHKTEKWMGHPSKVLVDVEMETIVESVRILEETSNNFSIKVHELKQLQELKGQMNPISIADSPSLEFQNIQSNMAQSRIEIREHATQIYSKLLNVRSSSLRVIQHWGLMKVDLDKDVSLWSIHQKARANGRNLDSLTISKIQSLSECLMEIVWQLRSLLITANIVRESHQNLLQQIKGTCTTPDLPEQISIVTALVRKLVQDTFLVMHQPCQVLKTNTRFHILPGQSSMEVCSLVGEKLGLKLSPPTVSVCIVDENTTQEIHRRGLDGDRFKKVVSKGRLLPDTARLDFCSEKLHSTAIFRQISLKDFYRNARKGNLGKEQTELVTEEKFALLFRSDFTVGDIDFKVWRLSLPIVIITHGSQECLGWAAVSWDNEFSQSDRIPFQLPDYVSWQGLSEMMNGRFRVLVGSSLSEQNLTYLAERLSIYQGFPERLTWSEVCKNNLSGKKFTFWEWFYEGAKLIEQHLKTAWNEGHVKGFIGKETSEDLLRNSGCLPGTFLLRFSESILGGISIVWLHSDGTPYSLAPFRSKDLAPQPFVEKLNQTTLHYSFPNVKKEIAFKTYYEEANRANVPDEITSAEDRRYIRFRNQVVIDDPSISQFDLDRRSSNPQVQPQTDVYYEQPNANGNTNNFLYEEYSRIDNFIDEVMSSCSQSNESNASSPQSSCTTNGNASVRSVDDTFSACNGNGTQCEEYFYLNL